MSWLEVYLRVAWACKTPFVILMDRHYWPWSIEELESLMPEYGRPYVQDVSDCDDAAFSFKGDMGHGTGIAFSRNHAWNIALCEDGVYHIEPQTGEVSRNKRALWVIV